MIHEKEKPPRFGHGHTTFGPPKRATARRKGQLIEVLDDNGNVTQTLIDPWTDEVHEVLRERQVEEAHFDISVVPLNLIKRVARNSADLYALTPEAFEHLIAELLSNDGWQVELTSRTRDDNIDVFAMRRDVGIPASMIVQCKRYKEDHKIGIDVVRSVMYTIDKYKTNFGMIATTSTFTSGAVSEKSQLHPWRLELRDHERIQEWCRYQCGQMERPPNKSHAADARPSRR